MVFLATTGQQATEVKVLVPPEEAVYHGEVKSFNPNKGYGFIGCDAFPGQDVFVLKSEMPGGFAPQGGHCKFKVKQESEKGPAATEVQLLGTAGNQYQQMEHMAFYSGSKGFSKAKDTFWQDLQAQILRSESSGGRASGGTTRAVTLGASCSGARRVLGLRGCRGRLRWQR
ncbi:unnamed protein product [Durusdinium trenchii]|uniref:CSD domain-containing protein n=1 Tax=Durusdinium trenchii TaxID=1381693 RepID=A0ABP0PP51_9DINO